MKLQKLVPSKHFSWSSSDFCYYSDYIYIIFIEGNNEKVFLKNEKIVIRGALKKEFFQEKSYHWKK